jgi:signal transduction histidine kinase
MKETIEVAMRFEIVREILSPPIFEDEEKTRIAGLFNGIAIAGILILTTAIVLRLATRTMNVRQFWVAFTVDIVILALLAIMRRGFVRVACLLFSVVLFIGVSFGVYINGGVSSSVASYFILSIVTTSLLLGNRAGIVSMIFSILAVFGFVQADSAGLIPYAKMESGVAHWLVYASVFGAVATVQRMAVRSIERALEATRLSEQKLLLSNRELERFAEIAAHDLQEPLRKIQAFGDLLQRKHSAMFEKEEQLYIERMQVAAHQGQENINNLLTYTFLDRGKKTFTLVDLNQIASDAVRDLQAEFAEADAEIYLNELPVIDADPSQMRQLFLRLLDNALKFHQPERALIVKVDSFEMGSNQVQITVEDNGIGFEQHYADRIFQPFQRLHSRDSFEGSGIGLAICRKIVERHGGKISASSTFKKGSIFKITLPMRNGPNHKE